MYIMWAVLALMAGTARANLIVNGDFATGDTTGWTVNAYYSDASSGMFEGFDNDTWGILSQTIDTTAGQDYQISLDTFASQEPGNEFAWVVDGTQHAINATSGWDTTIDTFTASGGTTDVALYFRTIDGSGTWQVDNVSVQAIPEPATAGLMIVSIGGILLGRRRFA